MMTKERREARLVTLKAAFAQLQARIKANPKHPRIDDYKARLNEYAASIDAIEG